MRRAEAEIHQARIQAQELRRACENLRAELDAMSAVSVHSMRRGYDDGPGAFPPSHFRILPPHLRFHDDGYNDGGEFAA